MSRPNQTKPEIEQAIEFHLRLDKKLGNTNRDSWPLSLREIYEKRGSDIDGNDKETKVQVDRPGREHIQPPGSSNKGVKKGWFD